MIRENRAVPPTILWDYFTRGKSHVPQNHPKDHGCHDSDWQRKKKTGTPTPTAIGRWALVDWRVRGWSSPPSKCTTLIGFFQTALIFSFVIYVLLLFWNSWNSGFARANSFGPVPWQKGNHFFVYIFVHKNQVRININRLTLIVKRSIWEWFFSGNILTISVKQHYIMLTIFYWNYFFLL